MSNHLSFDLETASADEIFKRPDFVRLGGLRLDGQPVLSTSGDEIAKALMDHPGAVTGHFVSQFDLIALAYWHGLDLRLLHGRMYDTQLAAYVFDPPKSNREGATIMPRGFYGLDQTCGRFGVDGKSADLKALAKEYGGYDLIDPQDSRYRSYLEGDLEASDGLYTAMRATERGYQPYLAREMRVGLLTASARLSGLRVDVPEIKATLARMAIERQEAIAELAAITGMPPGGANPVASKAGKEAIIRWMARQTLGDKTFQLAALPRTPKGAYSLGTDGLRELASKIRKAGGHPDLERVIRLVCTIVGQRTIYGTADSCRIGDRVHPQIVPSQSTGRWSVTNPGLTVFGKRGGRHVERRIILPDEGHVLVAIDLHQADARAVAALSQDPEYMRIFQEGRDIFAELAQSLYGDASRRSDVKPISHGWNYGRGPKAMAESGDASFTDAYAFDQMMRTRHSGIVRWQNEVRETAQSGGLLDNGFGRPLSVEPRFAYTQAPAFCGQSWTRDALAEGMLAMPTEFWPYIRCIVHDEIVVSVPRKDADEITREMVRCMEFEKDGVPITADRSGPGENWAQCYEKNVTWEDFKP